MKSALVIDGTDATAVGCDSTFLPRLLPSLKTKISGERSYIIELLSSAQYEVEVFDTKSTTTRDGLLDHIRSFLRLRVEEDIIIWYFGAGQLLTGDWCLPDGNTISFKDIFDLYRSFSPGAYFGLVTDCASSGQWLRDCGATLDEMGIAACGHHARNEGVWIEMYCSCLADEIPKENYFPEHCVSSIEQNLNIRWDSDGNQTSVIYQFWITRCRKRQNHDCEITGKWTQPSLVIDDDLYLYKTSYDRYERQLKLKTFVRIHNQDLKAVQSYQEALREGSAIIPRLTINLMGPGGVGKTCLRRHLLGLPFEHQPSTRGIETQVAMTSAKRWNEMSEKDREDAASVTIANNLFTLRKKKDTLDAIQPVEEQELNRADASSSLCTANQTDDDRTIIVQRKTEEAVGDKLKVSEITDLTRDKLQRIKRKVTVPGDYEHFPVSQKTEELVVNFRDQAGQGRFLMTHSSLTASRSRFKSTLNILVFNVCKPLDEKAVSVFRWNPDDEGEKQETHGVMVTTLKNFEHWITSEMIAEGHNAISPMTDHIGKGHDKKLLYPVFLFLATHGGERDATPQLLKRQNSLLWGLIRKCKIQSHLLRVGNLGLKTRSLSPKLQDNQVYCLVDNTLSGSSSQDPTIEDIREKGKQMAVSYWSKQPALPLPWLNLMQILAVFRQKTGRAIATLPEVYQLATENCHIPKNAVSTAMVYLNSFNAILHFSDAPQLQDKVFTDPQWLFDAMAIFITPPSLLTFADRHLHQAWLGVYETGIMVWSLADHLLREKANITQEEIASILEVLELFDVICSDESSNVKPGMNFFIPCLLTDCKTRLDPLTPASPFCYCPPSLLYYPVNVAVVPEQLFFRLVSQCVKRFGNEHNRPLLKRNRCLFYLQDLLKLEIRYVQEGSLIAVTLSCVSRDASFQNTAFIKHCPSIRQFITDSLDKAKMRGMKGLNLELHVCYAEGDHDDEIVSKDSTMCLTGYPPKNRQCLVTESGTAVDDLELVGLQYWFAVVTGHEFFHEREGRISVRREVPWPNLDDEKTFQKVAICVASGGGWKWRTVGYSLHQNVLDSKFDKLADDKERMLTVLHEWRADEGRNATASRLKEACHDADISGAVEQTLRRKGLIIDTVP